MVTTVAGGAPAVGVHTCHHRCCGRRQCAAGVLNEQGVVALLAQLLAQLGAVVVVVVADCCVQHQYYTGSNLQFLTHFEPTTRV